MEIRMNHRRWMVLIEQMISEAKSNPMKSINGLLDEIITAATLAKKLNTVIVEKEYHGQ